MTIAQLEYVLAMNEHQSFAKAAKACFVSQPALSMQIKKMEDDLKVELFDRTKKPIVPTEIGKQIIEQARICLSELNRVKDIIDSEENDISGEVRLGIIPTLSPYLLPLFSIQFLEKLPDVKLIVKEMLTSDIIYDLYNNKLDLGILVTPIDSPDLKHIPLFYEPFVAYMASNHSLSSQTQIDLQDLDLKDMWLLKEGHCFRSQTVKICGENPMKENRNALQFESGSLETLSRIVEKQYGYTLLPKLATLEFNSEQQKLVKEFHKPQPVREVSLIMSRRYMKRKLVQSLKQTIQESIPPEITQKGNGKIINWLDKS